ncbi:MAG: hypothetical protein ACYDG2_15375 [Ruminiclostridium sp.]
MIPFSFYKKSINERNKIVNEYYNLVVKSRPQRRLNELNLWCTNNLKIGSKVYSFKEVITAEFQELCTIQKHLYDNKPSLKGLFTFKKTKKGKARKSYYIKEVLYDTMTKEARKKLLGALELTVCPYCNRNYINPADDKTTCNFDHFYNKNDYPILAVSFYNLVPVCPACNSVKGTDECSYSPYDTNFKTNDLLNFDYFITNPDYLSNKNSIRIIINPSSKIRGNVKTLHLSELYKLHSDVVQEILQKATIFEAYSRALHSSFGSVFKSDKELARILLGNYIDEVDFGKRPLSKMMSDIATKAWHLK